MEPITDARIEAEKAANRGLVVNQLLDVLRICEEEGRASGDPRFLELRIRSLDKLMKLLRLAEPQAAVLPGSGSVDRGSLVSQAAVALDALELKMSAGS